MYLYNLLCMYMLFVYAGDGRYRQREGVRWRVLCDRNVNRQTFNFMSVCAESSRVYFQMDDAWENRTSATHPVVQQPHFAGLGLCGMGVGRFGECHRMRRCIDGQAAGNIYTLEILFVRRIS